MTIKERILSVITEIGIKKVEFFDKTGIAPSNFKGAGMKSELGGEKIANILSSYPSISAKWLLTGTGEMLSTNEGTKAIHSNSRDSKAIPLVSEVAVAGLGNSDFCISEQTVKEWYTVPKFSEYHVDFMIEVKGNSMLPNYSPGDIIACHRIQERSFIQWNHPHLIATREQGILLKRLFPCDDVRLTAVSDNPQFAPFQIPLEEITGIAIVIGTIRVE